LTSRRGRSLAGIGVGAGASLSISGVGHCGNFQAQSAIDCGRPLSDGSKLAATGLEGLLNIVELLAGRAAVALRSRENFRQNRGEVYACPAQPGPKRSSRSCWARRESYWRPAARSAPARTSATCSSRVPDWRGPITSLDRNRTITIPERGRL
jgi:hypothetical protein